MKTIFWGTMLAAVLLTAGDAKAQACSPGTYSVDGMEPCSPCSAGNYSLAGATACTPCDAGTFSSAGSAVCTQCSPGTFNPFPGQPSCIDCGPGTYEPSPGSIGCDECPGGQATPCNGNGVCSDGPSGTGTCACNVGYTGFACENGPGGSTTTSTTSTTLAGACAAVPETGCVVATKAGLQISKNTETPDKSRIKWKLGGGSLAVSQTDLGDPLTTTSWTLCIYDSSAGVSYLAGSLTVDPNAAWASNDPKGWKYKDKTGAEDGVTGVSLKTGDATKTKAQLKGAGASLVLPDAYDLANYFDQDTTVTVQLVKNGGPGASLCYTSEFDAADTKTNSAAVFKATAK
jgi:hypothetical protein